MSRSLRCKQLMEVDLDLNRSMLRPATVAGYLPDALWKIRVVQSMALR